MAYYEWRFQITRPGAAYGINKDSLVSRLEIAVVSSASCPMLSVGGGSRDDIYISGLNEQHLHYVLDSNALTLKCRGQAKFNTRDQEKNLDRGDKFILNLVPANYSHKIVFSNGVEILGKFRQEVETLPAANQRFLEEKYGTLHKLYEGNSSLLYKTGDGKVLKILRPTLAGNKAVVKRFRNAAKRFRKISTAPFFTRLQKIVLQPERQLYYVEMEYCAGETLKNYLARKGVLTLEEAKNLACSIAKRLAVMGRHGYCCRNLTPANILIGKDGEPRITGFFLVKSEEGTVTLPGARMVISSHSAPEQIQSAKQTDIQADMFSLGTIFYLMLIGEPPIATLNSLEYEQLLFSKGMPKVEEIRATAPHIPTGVCQLLAGLFSFNKKERPSPKDFLRFFGEKMSSSSRPATAASSPPIEQCEYRPPAPSNNVPVVAMLLSLVALLVVGYWYWWRQRSFDMDFSRQLPAATRGVMVFSSLSNFLSKIDLAAYPDLYNSAKGFSTQMLGGNVFDPEFFRDFGFDPDGALGIALLGDPVADPRLLAFIKIADYGKMLQSMQDQQKFRWAKLQPSKIAGIRCLVDNEKHPSLILYRQGEYAFVYKGKNQSKMIANFEQDIATAAKNLAEHAAFRQSMQGLRSRGDLFTYIDARSLTLLQNLAQRQQPQAKAAMFADEVLGYAFSLEFTDRGLLVGSYTHLRQGARLMDIYHTVPYNETSKFLQRIVGDPVACLYANNDISANWPVVKPVINAALKQDLRWSAGNIDEMINQMQQQLAKIGLPLDIEKQLLNCDGQLLGSIYSLPSSLEKMDFNALLAIAVKDSKQTIQLLEQVTAKAGTEVAKQYEIDGINAVNFTLPAAANKLTLTLGVVNNCLIITTRQELFRKIARQQYDYAVELEILDRVIAHGFIKLDRICSQLRAWQKMAPASVAAYLPTLFAILEKFYEARWTTTLEAQGVSQSCQLRTSKSLFAIGFEAIGDWQKQASKRPAPRLRMPLPGKRPGRIFPPSSASGSASGCLAKQKLDGIEVKLIKIDRMQGGLAFHFERNQDDYKYNTALEIKNFKSAGYSSFSMGPTLSFQQNMQPVSKNIPTSVDLTLTLRRSARYQDAQACIDVTLPAVNQCQVFNKSASNVGLKLFRAGIFQNKGVNPFAFGKVEQQYKFGKKKVYVYTKNDSQGWYELLVMGAISSKYLRQDRRKNLILFDPDKKFFGGKLNLTGNFSEDGATTHFAFCGPLFKNRCQQVKLCYFSDDYYQKGKKIFHFKNIRLK